MRSLLLSLILSALLVSAPVYPQKVVGGPVQTANLSIKTRFHVIDGQVVTGAINTLQDIWEVGGLIDLAVADGVLTIVSTSAQDTIAGTGAQRVKLNGNTSEAFPKFLSVTIDMDGTTPVVTSESYQGHSLAQARVTQSDDFQRRDLPTGTITITQNGVTIGQINPGELQTHHGFRIIPYGPNDEVETWTISAGQLNLLDLAGKADALAQLSLWKLDPNDQAHTNGRSVMQAAINPQSNLLFGETFDSGETFALRIECDQTGIEFFVDVGVSVAVNFPAAVQYTHELVTR